MTDDYMDDLPEDHGVNIANGIVIVTGLVLILAIYTMHSALNDHYGLGMLAP